MRAFAPIQVVMLFSRVLRPLPPVPTLGVLMLIASVARGEPATAKIEGLVGPIIANATWHDVSRPLRELAREQGARPRDGAETNLPHLDALPEPAAAPANDASSSGSEPFAARAPGFQRAVGRFTMPATGPNFTCGFAFGATPPSPSADVGLNHYVVMNNTTMMIFDKAGNTLLGPVNNNTIWTGFGGDCEALNQGTPVVLYDQLQDRWLLMQVAFNASPFYLCLAVSKTPDPTGEYFRWSIPLNGHFPEALKAAVWRDGYYFGYKSFTPSFSPEGNFVFALKRSEIVSGNPAPTMIQFLAPPTVASITGDGWLPADLDGTRMPPVGSPAYYVGSMDSGGPYGAPQDALTLWRFQADWTTPSNSTFSLASTLPVSAFDSIYPCTGGQRRCIPQPATTSSQWLDVQSYRQRMLSRVTYRNFGTHESIACNQSVEASPSMAGIRWYELRDPGGTPVVYQQGTYSPGTSDGIFRWNGSIAMDHQGNMALGYSVSNLVNVFPGIRYTGRLATDPLHTMPQGEGTVIDGSGIQTSTANRWGDYSCMSVDPSDDCTFWYVNEYYPTTSIGSWELRVGAFKFPGCESAVDVEDGPALPSATRLAPLGIVRGTVEVAFTLAGGASRRVTLDVMDVTGRRVRKLMNESLPGGRYSLPWDLRSDDGEALRPGVYHVRLVAGDEQRSEGVVLVR